MDIDLEWKKIYRILAKTNCYFLWFPDCMQIAYTVKSKYRN